MNIQKQAADKPLFPDLIWSRPERKSQAGKLLIIGGSIHGFAATVKAVEYAGGAGIGEVKALLPKGVEKYIGRPAGIVYTAQTASGSFAKDGAGEASGYAGWADALLLPGELTNNAETTIFVENLIGSASKPVVIANEAFELLAGKLKLPSDLSVVGLSDFRSLQRFVKDNALPSALLPTSTLEQRAALLGELTEHTGYKVLGLTESDQVLVVNGQQACLTKTKKPDLELAVHAAVLVAQFPAKLFEATVTAACI